MYVGRDNMIKKTKQSTELFILILRDTKLTYLLYERSCLQLATHPEPDININTTKTTLTNLIKIYK